MRCFLAGLWDDDPVLARAFVAGRPAIQDALVLDAEATCAADPAAANVDEVTLAYPGFYALAAYRLAHHLMHLGVPLLPRLMTERAHRPTGIDIHPGASIRTAIAIDHGTGIGLAMVAAVKGSRLILVMPESMSVERRRIMTAYGAELVLTPRELGMTGAIARAAELLTETPRSWMPQQFENPSNVAVHQRTTAREILADFPRGWTI